MSRPEPGLNGFDHRFETVEGVRLHYVAGGKADGDVQVFLAGFPESWYAWRKVMPPKASKEQQETFMQKTEALAPRYRTELLKTKGSAPGAQVAVSTGQHRSV